MSRDAKEYLNAKKREKEREKARKKKKRKDKIKKVTIQLHNTNNASLDNIALRTALTLQPLFIKFPLVANKATKLALMLLFFDQFFLTKSIIVQNIRA
jgi:hypothetical protein